MNRDEFYEYQFRSIIQFYINYRGFRTIEKYMNELKNNQFWLSTHNSNVELLLMNWCNIFGSFSNKTHWSNNCTKKEINHFREIILEVLDMNLEEWKVYQKSIVEFRNKYVAHHENGFNKALPKLENTLKLMQAYEMWIKKLLSEKYIYYVDDLYEYVDNYVIHLEEAIKKTLK